jgi:hypothetical protein
MMLPQEAIARNLHVGGFRTPLGSAGFRKPREVLPAGSGVVIRDSDCEPLRSEQVWTLDQWYRAVEVGGLWRKVGMWDFVPWDDPAAVDVAFAHRCPDAAGRKIYRLEGSLRRLGWIVKLLEEAIRDMEAQGTLGTMEAYSKSKKRVERLRKWLP